jgi:hypothetical protein
MNKVFDRAMAKAQVAGKQIKDCRDALDDTRLRVMLTVILGDVTEHAVLKAVTRTLRDLLVRVEEGPSETPDGSVPLETLRDLFAQAIEEVEGDRRTTSGGKNEPI